ncbi:endoplasmic reticulum membrane-associated RNA degradation protein-like [Physella acuta]|uniref:endoplasmic reticulum membrane-associated RNA degradation protein-like n=1 Tax=Physella acuta TaxID=109671 RepID=UPI0027DADAD0|nr:endoplasmic reticulum membrane-associated RNA degradation protein-like [Physella acuta]
MGVQEIDLCYEDLVRNMAHIFKFSEELVSGLSQAEFLTAYGEFFQWTANSDLFIDCFELLSHKSGAYDILALLLMSGGLERALGNLYLMKGSQCPALLKDLLVTKELQDILGLPIIVVLHVLLGPPVSMNLRNIAWHGFLSDNELPRRYIYFLLLLSASVGKMLKEGGMTRICAREYVTLSKSDHMLKHMPEMTEDHVSTCEQLVLGSWLVADTNRNLFKSSFSLYRQAKFGWCAVQLFPLLEHTLRRLFVVINNCPERLITAEATTLYTTFEEILEPNLPDGLENKLVPFVGEALMNLLLDLLVYPSGPRARDKLGHGEVDYNTVPESLPLVLIYIFSELAALITADKSSEVKGYTSLYHPVAQLKQKIRDLSSLAGQMSKVLCVLPDLQPREDKDVLEAFTKNNPKFQDIQRTCCQFVQQIKAGPELDPLLLKPPGLIPSLLKEKRAEIATERRKKTSAQMKNTNVQAVSECEVVNLMTRILSETEVCIRQITSALQLRQGQLLKKELRSRQRDNLKRLLSVLPYASVFVNSIITLSTWIFSHLDNYCTLDQSACKSIQKFLKSTLQACENLRSYSSVDVNKWTQAEELILTQLKAAVDWTGRFYFP